MSEFEAGELEAQTDLENGGYIARLIGKKDGLMAAACVPFTAEPTAEFLWALRGDLLAGLKHHFRLAHRDSTLDAAPGRQESAKP